MTLQSILLVEDSIRDAELYRSYLQESKEEYDVDVAPTLLAASEMIAVTEYGAIVSDLGLPDSDGLLTVQKIFDMAPNVPLVVLSGNADTTLARKAVREGAQDYLVKGDISSEALVRVVEYAEERQRRNKEDNYLAYHDELTGLANRTLLTHTLKHDLALSERNKSMVAVLTIDLDGFKKINDKFGHDVGDQMLKFVGTQLKKVVRRSDTPGRWGGDEFVVIQNNFTDIKQIVHLCNRLIKAISEPLKLPIATINVGCSIGIAVCPDHTRDPNKLLEMADTALYKGKKQYGSCFTFFNDAC